MKAELIITFMKAIGIPKPEPQGTWFMGSCPLAPWRHKKGTDSRASFGINTVTGKFNCFTCDSGTLERLVQTLELYVQQKPELAPKYDFVAARDALDGLDEYTEPLPEYSEIVPAGEVFKAWPDWALDQFIPWRQAPRAVWWMKHGRLELNPKNQPIDDAVADKLKLMYDPSHDRIVSPFWTWTGKLAGARGRACTNDANLKHFDYSWQKVNNSAVVWYNETCFNEAAEKKKAIVIVEGQFDCASVLRVYPYCIAGLTAKGAASRMKTLQSCESVVMMLDNDETGNDAWTRYKQFLLGKVPIARVEIPSPYKDPGEMPADVLADLLDDLF